MNVYWFIMNLMKCIVDFSPTGIKMCRDFGFRDLKQHRDIQLHSPSQYEGFDLAV